MLLVDDDGPFVQRLARAMEKRGGFLVETAESVAEGRAKAQAATPAYAVVDLRLGDGNGLEIVEVLRERRPDCRIVVVTGYGAIATAVAAVKIGAVDYLAKPTDADDITRALLARDELLPPPPENPMSADRVRWEHIQRFTSNATAISRKLRGVLTCTAGRFSVFWPNAARNNADFYENLNALLPFPKSRPYLLRIRE